MQALIRYAETPQALEWREWPDPQPGPGEVLVKIERAAVCSTDVAIWRGVYRGRQPNVIPGMVGHEAAGTVEAVGERVADLAVGDRVALQVIWGHPQSPHALNGQENLDPDWYHLGTAHHPGAFADRIAVAAEHAIKVSDAVTWDDAALVEALSISVNAMELAPLHAGETFVAVGPGTFGLLGAQLALRAGAGTTIVAGLAGVDDARLRVAADLGVDHVVAVGEDPADAVAEILERSGGGADVVFDNGGTAGSTRLSLDVVAPAGRVALTGFTPSVEIEPLRQIIRKGVSLHGVAASQRRHYGPALRLIEAGLSPQRIISHRLPLSQATDAMALMDSREATKVLLAS